MAEQDLFGGEFGGTSTQGGGTGDLFGGEFSVSAVPDTLLNPPPAPERSGGQTPWYGPPLRGSILHTRRGEEYLDIVSKNQHARAGFLESIFDFTQKDIPFYGDAVSATEVGKVLMTVNKIDNGETPTDDELVNLNMYLAKQERVSNAKFGGDVGNLLRGQVKFWVEIGAVVGASATVLGGAALGGGLVGQKVMKEAAEEAVEKGVPRILRRTFIGTRVQEALKKQTRDATLGSIEQYIKAHVPGTISKEVLKRSAQATYLASNMAVHGTMMSLVTGGQGAKRFALEKQLEAALTGAPPMEAADALKLGIIDSIIQYGSEFVGADIMRLVNRTAFKVLGKEVAEEAIQAGSAGSILRLIGDKFNIPPLDIAASFARSAGAGGVIEEVLEERTAGFFGGLFGTQGDDAGLLNAVEQSIPSFRQLSTEIVAFALPGVAAHTTAAALREGSKLDIFGGITVARANSNIEALKENYERLNKMETAVAEGDVLTPELQQSLREEAQNVRERPKNISALRTLNEKLFGLQGSIRQLIASQNHVDVVNLFNTVYRMELARTDDSAKADEAAMKSVSRTLARFTELHARGVESKEEADLINELARPDEDTGVSPLERLAFSDESWDEEWMLNKDANYNEEVVQKLAKVGRVMHLMRPEDMSPATIKTAEEYNAIRDLNWEDLSEEQYRQMIDFLAPRFASRLATALQYDTPSIIEAARRKFNAAKAIIHGYEAEAAHPVSAGDVVREKGSPSAPGQIVESVNHDKTDPSKSTLKFEGIDTPVPLDNYDRVASSIDLNFMNATMFLGTKAEIESKLRGQKIPDTKHPFRPDPDGNKDKDLYVVRLNATNDNAGNLYFSIDADPLGWVEDVIESAIKYKNSYRDVRSTKDIGRDGQRFMAQLQTLIDNRRREIAAIPDGKTSKTLSVEEKRELALLKQLEGRISPSNPDGQFEMLGKMYLFARMKGVPFSSVTMPADFDTATVLAQSIPESMWTPIDRKMERDVGTSMMNALREITNYVKPVEITTAEDAEMQEQAGLVPESALFEELPMEFGDDEDPAAPEADDVAGEPAAETAPAADEAAPTPAKEAATAEAEEATVQERPLEPTTPAAPAGSTIKIGGRTINLADADNAIDQVFDQDIGDLSGNNASIVIGADREADTLSDVIAVRSGLNINEMESDALGNPVEGNLDGGERAKIASLEFKARNFSKMFDSAVAESGYGERVLYKMAHTADRKTYGRDAIRYGENRERATPEGWSPLSDEEKKIYNYIRDRMFSRAKERGPAFEKATKDTWDSVLKIYESFVIAPHIVRYRHEINRDTGAIDIYDAQNTKVDNSPRYMDVSQNLVTRYLLKSMGIEKLIDGKLKYRVVEGSVPSRARKTKLGVPIRNPDGELAISRTRGKGLTPDDFTPDFVDSLNWFEFWKAHDNGDKFFWITAGRYGEKRSILQVQVPLHAGAGIINQRVSDYAKEFNKLPQFAQDISEHPDNMGYKFFPSEGEYEAGVNEGTAKDHDERQRVYHINHTLAMWDVGKKMFGSPAVFDDINDMVKRLNTVFTPGVPFLGRFKFFVFEDHGRFDGMAFHKESSLGKKFMDHMGPMILNKNRHHILKAFGSYTDKKGNFVSWKPLFVDITQLEQYEEFKHISDMMGDDMVAIPRSSLKVNGLKKTKGGKGTAISIANIINKDGSLRKNAKITQKQINDFDSTRQSDGSRNGFGSMYLNQDMNYDNTARTLFTLTQLDTIRMHIPKVHHDALVAIENRILGMANEDTSHDIIMSNEFGTPQDPSQDNRDHDSLFMLWGNLVRDIESGSVTIGQALQGLESANATRALTSGYSKLTRMRIPRILRSVVMGVSNEKRIKLRRNPNNESLFAPQVVDTNIEKSQAIYETVLAPKTRMVDGVSATETVEEVLARAEQLVRDGGPTVYPWLYRINPETSEVTNELLPGQLRVNDNGTVSIPGMPMFYARIPASGLPFMAMANLGVEIGSEDASLLLGNFLDDFYKGQDADGDQAQLFMLSIQDGNVVLDDSVAGLRNKMFLLWFQGAQQYSDAMNAGLTTASSKDFLGEASTPTQSWYIPSGQASARRITESGKSALEIFAAQAHVLRLMNFLGISFPKNISFEDIISGNLETNSISLKATPKSKPFIVSRTESEAKAIAGDKTSQIEYDSYWINNMINLLVDDIKNPSAAALGITKETAPYFVVMMAGAIRLKTDEARREYGENMVNYVLKNDVFNEFINRVRNGESERWVLKQLSQREEIADDYKQLAQLVSMQRQMFGLYRLWSAKYKLPKDISGLASLARNVDIGIRFLESGKTTSDSPVQHELFSASRMRTNWITREIMSKHPAFSRAFRAIRNLVRSDLDANRNADKEDRNRRYMWTINSKDEMDLLRIVLGVNAAHLDLRDSSDYESPEAFRKKVSKILEDRNALRKKKKKVESNAFLDMISVKEKNIPWLLVGEKQKRIKTKDRQTGRRVTKVFNLLDKQKTLISIAQPFDRSITSEQISAAQRDFNKLEPDLQLGFARYAMTVWGAHDLRPHTGNYTRLMGNSARANLDRSMLTESRRWVLDEVSPGEKQLIREYFRDRRRSIHIPYNAYSSDEKFDLESNAFDRPLEYGGYPVEYRKIDVAAQADVEEGTGRKVILVNPVILHQKYVDKAWTKPRIEGVTPLPLDQFDSFEEWREFVLEHERQHFLNPRAGRDRAEYENEINADALAALSLEAPDRFATSQEDAEGEFPLTKVISGGQTGADVTALEVARDMGFETGGTAPLGYRTEEGSNEELKAFGLVQDSSSSYPPRTKKNVADSDGTVLFGVTTTPGSTLTQRFASQLGKPFVANPSPAELRQWIIDNNISTLNVAGNRASVNPDIVEDVAFVFRAAIEDVFKDEDSAPPEQLNLGLDNDTDSINASISLMSDDMYGNFGFAATSDTLLNNIFLKESREYSTRNQIARIRMIRLARIMGLISGRAYAIPYDKDGRYGAEQNLEIEGWSVFDPLSNEPMKPVENTPEKREAMRKAKAINKGRGRLTKAKRNAARELDMAITFAIEDSDRIIEDVVKKEMTPDDIREFLQKDKGEKRKDRHTTDRKLAVVFAMKRNKVLSTKEASDAFELTDKQASERIELGLSRMGVNAPGKILVPDVKFYHKTVTEIRQDHGSSKFNKVLKEAKSLLAEARAEENEYVSPWLNPDEEWIREAERYVTHEYDIRTESDEELMQQYFEFYRFAEQTGRAKTRVHASYEEAAFVAGLKPKTASFTKLFERRNNSVWKTAMNRSLLSQMSIARGYSGEPLMLPVWNEKSEKVMFAETDAVINNRIYEQAGRQLVDFMNSEAIRAGEKPKYKYDPIADPRKQLNKLIDEFDPESKGYVKMADKIDTKTFRSLSAVFVKEGDAHRVMKKLLLKPINNPVYNTISAVNNLGKDMSLSFSGFHYFSLFESWTAVFGFIKSNPGYLVTAPSAWKSALNLMRHMQNDMQMYTKWSRAGLKAEAVHPDVQNAVFDKGLERALQSARENEWHALEKGYEFIKYLREGNSKVLWGIIHPAMKLQASEFIFNEVRNNPKRYSLYDNVSDHNLRIDIAQLVNDAFGGQEFERALWDNPRTRQILGALWFAQDWTTSSANIAGSLFGWNFLTGTNISPLQKRWARVRYWPAMFGIVMFALPNAMQALIWKLAGDEDEDDVPFVWQNEVGKREGPFGAPGMGAIDITPLLRKLPGYTDDPKSKRRVFMRFAKQATEVFEGWIEKPVQTMLSKSSVVVRTAYEQIFAESTGGWDLDFAEMGMSGTFVGKNKGVWGGRASYVARKFAPMSIVQLLEGRPSTFVAPTSMGMSRFEAQKRMAQILTAYAHDPAWNIIKDNPTHLANLRALFPELLNALERNGYADVVDIFNGAKRRVLGNLYNEFFRALNDQDQDKLEDLARAVLRVHAKYEDLQQSMEDKFAGIEGFEFDLEKQQATLEAFKANL